MHHARYEVHLRSMHAERVDAVREELARIGGKLIVEDAPDGEAPKVFLEGPEFVFPLAVRRSQIRDYVTASREIVVPKEATA